ncbi:MAG: pilus assembly protein [Propionibacteriaceae bacterium]|jgi:Flp pilus assembly protein TadG|nr:pilus assembly protein [Propionibacteriaceae bacterium]
MRLSGGERGSVTVEMVVLMPVLLAILFGGIQAGVVFHARHIAIAAAQEGARTAAAYQASLPDGISTARNAAVDWAGQSLTGIQVTGQRTATRVSITVQGSAISLLPGVSWPIEQTATLPVERLE